MTERARKFAEALEAWADARDELKAKLRDGPAYNYQDAVTDAFEGVVRAAASLATPS